jgi:hypothetical protein
VLQNMSKGELKKNMQVELSPVRVVERLRSYDEDTFILRQPVTS